VLEVKVVADAVMVSVPELFELPVPDTVAPPVVYPLPDASSFELISEYWVLVATGAVLVSITLITSVFKFIAPSARP